MHLCYITFETGFIQNEFHVSLSRPTQSLAPIVSYDKIDINIGDAFSSFRSRYFAPFDGLYIFYIIAKLPANLTADIRLSGTPDMSNILRNTYCNYVEIVAMRENMRLLTKSTDLWVSSEHPLLSDNVTFPTSFGGFHLNTLVKSFVAFAVKLTKPVSQEGNIPFDYIYYQSSALWNTQTNVFVAPKSGLYYFSLSIGTTAGIVIISLRINKSSAVQSLTGSFIP